MPTKKRNRAAMEAEPYKSQNFQFDPSTYNVNEDVPDTYMVKFTNGELVCDEGVNFAVYHTGKKTNSSAFRKKQIVAESDNMIYKGHNTGLFAPSLDYKEVIGIFDRKTNVCKLYSTEAYVLNPDLRGEKDEEEVNNEETARQQMDALTSAFGGSKKKKTMQTRHQNVISGDSLISAMQTAASTSTVTNPPESTPEKNSLDDILPPYVLEASTPEGAYPLDGIITEGMMTALMSQTEEANTEEDPVKSTFLLEIMKQLPRAENLRARRVAIICYMRHLFKLFTMTYQELRKTKELLPNDMPGSLKRAILQRFVVKVGSRFTIPARKKDAILAYILILALHLQDFNMETAQLCSDLKVTTKKLHNHLHVIGCKTFIDKKSKKQRVELKMPLKLGEPPVKRTKRK